MAPNQKRKQLIINELPKDGVVRFSDITRLVGFSSRTTLHKKLKANEFPPPKMVNGHVRYWSVDDVREYLSGKTSWNGGGICMNPKLLLIAAVAVFLLGALTAGVGRTDGRPEYGKRYRPVTVTEAKLTVMLEPVKK